VVINGEHYTVSELPLNQCLSIFMIASYLYYIRFHSIITDHEFDEISQKLLHNWDDVTHVHKHLVSVDDLRAGSLFNFGEDDYPLIVRGSADMWVREAEEGKVAGD